MLECFDWTDGESSDDGALPSDQVQRGTAVTLALRGFGKKSAASQLLARETWQSLSTPKIKSKGERRGRDRNRSLVFAFCPHFRTFFKSGECYAEPARLYLAAEHSCNYNHSYAGAVQHNLLFHPLAAILTEAQVL